MGGFGTFRGSVGGVFDFQAAGADRAGSVYGGPEINLVVLEELVQVHGAAYAQEERDQYPQAHHCRAVRDRPVN